MIVIDKVMNEEYDASSLALVQRKKYIKLLAEVYGMKMFFLNIFNDNNKQICILPFFIVRDKLIKRKIVSMPFDGAFGGPVFLYGNNMDMNKGEWIYLINWAKANNIPTIEIRTRNSNNKALKQLGFSEYSNLIGSELELSSISDAWKKLNKGHKWSINKFKKNKYILSKDSTYQDIKEFYHIMSKNMKLYGTPMYPLSYFEKMWNEYSEKENVILVKCTKDNKLIGGAFVLFNGEVAIYKYCSVISAYIQDCVYHGIVWYIINESIRRKCKVLNLGTSFIDDQGLIYFKEAFGAKSYTVYSYLYQEKSKNYHTVDAMRKKYNWIIKIWRHLPLFLVERLSYFFWKNFC